MPPGWMRARLGDVFELKYGKALPERNRTGGGLPVYGSNGIVGRHATSLTQGETLVIGRKGSVGEVHYSSAACSPIDTTYYIDVFKGMPARFWFHQLKHLPFGELNRATAIPGLNREDAYAIEVVVPPIGEQRRIARKLDALDEGIGRCSLRLERVATLLRRFREAVLEAAVSGRLTEEWREQHNGIESWASYIASRRPTLPSGYQRLSKQQIRTVPIEHEELELPSSWSIQTVAQLYEARALIDFADGNHGSLYPRKDEFGADGALFLTAQQVNDRFQVNLSDCPRLRRDKADQLTKGWALAGDVLLSHNATVGRVARLSGFTEPALLGTSLTFYRFNPGYMDAQYATYMFASPFFQRQLRSVMKQTTRDQVPITKQASLHVICPPIEEQREIARIVELLLSGGQKADNRQRAVTELVDAISSSLLDRAFTGKLVPQDPRGESAREMLKRTRVGRTMQKMGSQRATVVVSARGRVALEGKRKERSGRKRA